MKLEDLLNKQKITEKLEEPILLGSEEQQVVSDDKLPDYLVNAPEIVGYPSLEMQQIIYDWVIEDLPMWGQYSIKDFGAGRGDFFRHLVFRPLATSPIPQYTGFEKRESMVLAGRQKTENINLLVADYLSSDIITDYTICIGTLSEDHGQDKWEFFNRTLNHAINTTKSRIIFVLPSNMDNLEGFLDYPLEEMFYNIPKNIRFTIDYTRLEDIYKLTVHIGSYN